MTYTWVHKETIKNAHLVAIQGTFPLSCSQRKGNFGLVISGRSKERCWCSMAIRICGPDERSSGPLVRALTVRQLAVSTLRALAFSLQIRMSKIGPAAV